MAGSGMEEGRGGRRPAAGGGMEEGRDGRWRDVGGPRWPAIGGGMEEGCGGRWPAAGSRMEEGCGGRRRDGGGPDGRLPKSPKWLTNTRIPLTAVRTGFAATRSVQRCTYSVPRSS
jgi:hypothetical protein